MRCWSPQSRRRAGHGAPSRPRPHGRRMQRPWLARPTRRKRPRRQSLGSDCRWIDGLAGSRICPARASSGARCPGRRRGWSRRDRLGRLPRGGSRNRRWPACWRPDRRRRHGPCGGHGRSLDNRSRTQRRCHCPARICLDLGKGSRQRPRLVVYLRRLLCRRGDRSWRRHRRSGRRGFFARGLLAERPEMLPHLLRNIVLDSAGVRPLIGDP